MRSLACICVILGQIAAASAGEFTKIGESGGTYRFTECAAPAMPDLSVDPSLKGRKAQRAFNRSIRAYNVHVDASNKYLQCLSEEAGRDLNTYYAAVNASFEDRQGKVIGAIEAMRIELGLDEDPDADLDAALETELLGAGAPVIERPADNADRPAIDALKGLQGDRSTTGNILELPEDPLKMKPIGD